MQCRQPPPDTPSWERRLVRDAAAGDHDAQHQLLALYEPMVRRIVRGLFLPGGEREDLAQEARLGILDAARVWDPTRRVPFRCFARLCAEREARMAVNAARAHKHQVLTTAYSLERRVGGDDQSDEDNRGEPWLRRADVVQSTGRPDEDPVAKAIAREELRAILARARMLSRLERRALAMSANDRSHEEIAGVLGVRPRGVNNALQRARRKLVAPEFA
jgi:RNA polymerase sporulation-specific sigma factor